MAIRLQLKKLVWEMRRRKIIGFIRKCCRLNYVLQKGNPWYLWNNLIWKKKSVHRCNQVKIRSYWNRVGPESNDWCPYKRKEKMWTHRCMGEKTLCQMQWCPCKTRRSQAASHQEEASKDSSLLPSKREHVDQKMGVSSSHGKLINWQSAIWFIVLISHNSLKRLHQSR